MSIFFNFTIFGNIKIKRIIEYKKYQVDFLKIDNILQTQSYSYLNKYANYNRFIRNIRTEEFVEILKDFNPTIVFDIKNKIRILTVESVSYENNLLSLIVTSDSIILENTDVKMCLNLGIYKNTTVNLMKWDGKE